MKSIWKRTIKNCRRAVKDALPDPNRVFPVRLINRFIPPTSGLVLIHVGKCGGSSLRKAINQLESGIPVETIHIKKPIYKPKCRYIVVARGPISRTLSAFNWRYKLVVEDEVQKNRYSGEYEVLKKYKTLNRIAEALYDPDGRPNRAVHKEIRKIHHIRENIAFYLKDFLKVCPPDQISAVLMQESLDSDIQRVFGISNVGRVKDNRPANHPIELSEAAERNLKRFLFEDYQALLRLYCYGKIDKDILIKAI